MATFIIEYTPEGVVLTAKFFFIKFRIYPEREKRFGFSMSRRKARKIKKELDEQEKRKKEKKAKKIADKKARKLEAKNKGSKVKSPSEILDILDLVRSMLSQLTGKFLKHIKTKLTRLRITVGTGDAASTAVAYGAITQSINILFPILENSRNFKLPSHKNLYVISDFTADESRFDFKLSFSIRLGRILHFGAAAFFEFIKYFFKKLDRKESHGQPVAPFNINGKNKKTSQRKKGI